MKRCAAARVRRLGGFTLVELLVTLALVAIAASVVLPLATIIETRAKETELRRALRTIRTALDNYKAAADAGAIDKPTGTSGYPQNLQVLVAGAPRSAAFGLNSKPMVFLRSIPRDPFFEDRTTPAVQTWNTRGYGSQQGDFSAKTDVFDVSSKSERAALDGTRYNEW
ncbi:MAG: type II secretion system protein [Rhodoferax sp.]